MNISILLGMKDRIKSGTKLMTRDELEKGWDKIVLGAVLYNLITLPFRLAFSYPFTGSLFFLDCLADGVYLVDLIGAFIIHWSSNSSLQLSTKNHRWSYWRYWAHLDILGSIPFDHIARFSLGSLSPAFIALLRTPRLLKGIHFAHFYLKRRKVIGPQALISPLFRRVAWVLIIVHVLGCGWFGLDQLQEFSEQTWVAQQNLREQPLFARYLYSIYWSLTTITTVGYGDLTPKTPVEIIYAMFTMLSGVVIWAYLIASITNYLSNRDTTSHSFRQKLAATMNFLEYREVPSPLQKRILKYYQELWDSNRAFTEADILSDLPSSLKSEISYFLNRDIVHKVPLFQGMEEGFIHSIVCMLQPQYFRPGDVIIRKGTIGHEMYFVRWGEVEILSSEGQEAEYLVGEGEFFGELSLLQVSQRSATVRAKTSCELFVLHKKDFEKVLKVYPDFNERLQKIARLRQESSSPSLQK